MCSQFLGCLRISWGDSDFANQGWGSGNCYWKAPQVIPDAHGPKIVI